MWFVHRIVSIRKVFKHILPIVECVLKSGKNKITVVGWLPCHHSNVGYTLKHNNLVIQEIENIVCTRKKSRIPKVRDQYYIDLAEKSYSDVALWTVAVMYPFSEILNMDIKAVFQLLTRHIEHVCHRGSPHAVHLYDKTQAKKSIQRGLVQMGELPYIDWAGFEARMSWQLQTQWWTASLQKPSHHVQKLDQLVEHNHKWSTLAEVDTARALAQALTPLNTKLILGSLSPNAVPPKACILVRNAEDAYRAQCHLDWGYAEIYMLQTNKIFHQNRNLGLVRVKELPPDVPHLFVAWSHLWGIEDWTALIARSQNTTSYTCVGRLDQFPSGRGQVFRDMVESERFEITTAEHKMTHNVTMVQTDNIPEFVATVVAKHDTVQCFADEQFQCPLDTKRIQLFNPLRIRTLRVNTDGTDPPLPGIPMVEEFFINTETCTTLNKSVIPVHGFNGVHVHAAVYICSEDTTPFQIRVAQTHAREALYVVNCQTNLFLLTKKCKKRITISFF